MRKLQSSWCRNIVVRIRLRFCKRAVYFATHLLRRLCPMWVHDLSRLILWDLRLWEIILWDVGLQPTQLPLCFKVVLKLYTYWYSYWIYLWIICSVVTLLKKCLGYAFCLGTMITNDFLSDQALCWGCWFELKLTINSGNWNRCSRLVSVKHGNVHCVK